MGNVQPRVALNAAQQKIVAYLKYYEIFEKAHCSVLENLFIDYNVMSKGWTILAGG